MPLSVGDRAPEFELHHEPKAAPVRLADFLEKGPVVLLFFPLAFSSTCTEEMCTVAEDYGAWEAVDAQVLGISVDSPWVNVRFARECGATFPILSDFNRTASRAYDVLYEEFYGLEGVSKRAAFVVDRAGRIAYAWVRDDAGIMPPLEEIRAVVAGLG